MKKTLVSLATVTALTGITAQGVSANAYHDDGQSADTYQNEWSYSYTEDTNYSYDYNNVQDFSVNEAAVNNTEVSYDVEVPQAPAPETVEADVEGPQAPSPEASTVSTNNDAASTAHSVASGKSYVYGGNSATAVDCSALTQQFMKEHKGIDIPRTVAGQQAAGTQVSDPQPGDLVVFNNGTHVGVYIGNGQMVDALNPSEHVGERAVSYVSGHVDGYYRF